MLNACVQVPGYAGRIRCPPRGVLCTNEHSVHSTVADETRAPTTAIVNSRISADSHSSSKLQMYCYIYTRIHFCLTTFYLQLTTVMQIRFSYQP